MRLNITLAALLFSLTLAAQTFNVKVGSVLYQFPAEQAGEMQYADGTTLTVMGKTFTLSEVETMYVDDATVSDSTVVVTYSDNTASVVVPGNVAAYVTPTVSGAHVSIAQSDEVSDDVCGEITYSLTGSSSDGEFYLSGSYKSTVALNGLELTNATPVYNGAAICVMNGKRIDISVKKGTTNTLKDASTSWDQKACLYVKGHAEFKGQGSLTVYGNYKHAIKTADYCSVRKCTLTIPSAVGDGINCNQYFLMESGTLTISGVGDDGIQAELDGTESVAASDDDHTDEDTGNIYIEDGTLSVTASETAAKCIKSAGDIYVNGGTVTINAKGAVDTSDTSDLSYTSGFKADGSFYLQGGETTITVTGAAGRGIAVDQTFSSTDGTLTVTNSGALASSGSTYFSTAKGIKAGNVNIAGGTITVTASGACAKGIQSDNDDDSSLGLTTISAGTVNVTVSGAGAYDGTEKDAKGAAALKADNTMTISGGTLTLKSTGTGGKAIKAGGKFNVTGGTTSATSTGSQYKYSSSYTASPKAIKSDGAMTISGGTIVASSSNHEGIESKSTMDITGGYVYAYASDDAINAASHLTINGDAFVMANSSGNDGLDANGNMYIKGGNVVAVATRQPEVGLDANTEGGYQLYITGGNIVAIGGFENGCTISNGTAYQTSSYSKGSWYGLYNGSTLAFAFKVPSNSSMGTSMVVYTTNTAALKSGVTGSGTSFWNGYGYSSCSGGSSVSLSSYSGGGGMGPGGNNGPGGRW